MIKKSISLLSILYLSLHTLWSQDYHLSLFELVTEIENQSDWTVNYDAAWKNESIAINRNDTDRITENLESIFMNSLFDFTMSGKSILLTPAPKKEYQLCGYVKSQTGNSPLPLATIYLDNYQFVQTDESGFFSQTFHGIKNDFLTISYLGYKEQIIRLHNLNENECIDFILEHDLNLVPDNIVITDYLMKGIEEGLAFSSYEIPHHL